MWDGVAKKKGKPQDKGNNTKAWGLLMNMVDGSTLLTTIFVLIDDWYQQKGLPPQDLKLVSSTRLTCTIDAA